MSTSPGLLLHRTAARLARKLPRPVAVGLARGIAVGFRALSPGRRAAVRANLARLRPGAGARALDCLVAATFAAFAESLIDAWRLDLRDGGPACTVEGADALRAVLAGGRGVVLWSGHFGNWELAAAALAREGFDVAALARAHADPGVDRFFAARRAAAGVRIVGGCALARGARTTLRERGLLALLGDRRFGGAGRSVALCGGRATLPAAAVALARRTGAAIVPGFVERVAPGRWRVTFEPALEPGDSALAELARALERRIVADPTQWFVFESVWDDVQVEGA